MSIAVLREAAYGLDSSKSTNGRDFYLLTAIAIALEDATKAGDFTWCQRWRTVSEAATAVALRMIGETSSGGHSER